MNAMNPRPLLIGWAQTSITPTRPLLMEGQMYMRYSQYVHDPLTATALALDNGETSAVFVSMDMTEVPEHALPGIRWAASEAGIDPDCISFNVTHTHNASSFYNDFMRCENEQVYDPVILPHFDAPEDVLSPDESEAFFIGKIAALIKQAWASRAPGGISSAHEYAAVAFNRRPQFERDGKLESVMYGDCSREDFRRFEGGTDTSVEFLYTWDAANRLTGVVCNVPCPSQVYELHCFLSADYWKPTRSAIRERFGSGIYVLPMCGAAGDLCPIDLIRISRDNKQALLDWGGQTKEVFRNFDMTLTCQGIAGRIADAVQRGYREAVNTIDHAPVFRHCTFEMQLPIRQVSEAEYAKAVEQVKAIHARFSAEHPMTMADLVAAFEPQGVVLRYRQQRENPNYGFRCHIVRLGDAAIATNPFELYHEFALRLKARARAPQVFVVQLSNGCGGYLPTRAAVEGGSYSSKAASTTCGPEGGDALVARTLEVIDELFAD